MLQRDLQEITAVSLLIGHMLIFFHFNLATQHPGPLVPDDYVFTTWNRPFAPADRRSAEIDSGKDSVRRTLLQNWKMVDTETRKR